MKDFRTIEYDASKVQKELSEFDTLLKSKASLSERDDLKPFFEKREQFSAFLGTYGPMGGPATHLAYEFPFLGDFAADLIVGNREQAQYLIVELEDGASNSVFTKLKGKKTKEWSRRFDHGYSQLIDWFCCLDDYRQTAKFIEEFGPGYVTFHGMLVVGRNAGMSDDERRRLKWRAANVVINSKPITCVTFDDLHEHLRSRLALYFKGTKSAKK